MAELEWVVYCIQCGEIYKAPNGGFAEAAAKKHKREHLDHIVILGTYITATDAVLSKS